MSLLNVKNRNKRAAHARLIVAADELSDPSHDEWASLGEFARACRMSTTHAAARRHLYRAKGTFAEHGVLLEIREAGGPVFARFQTQAIRDLVAVDIRRARRIVEISGARREGREPDLKDLAWDTDVLNAEAIRQDYEDGESFASIMDRYVIGAGRLKKILKGSKTNIRDPKKRVRIEDVRPKHVVAEALAALRRAEFLTGVAAILKCSVRSARRFAKRHGFVFQRLPFAVPINGASEFWKQALERWKSSGSDPK
jgi:hypothetical protein